MNYKILAAATLAAIVAQASERTIVQAGSQWQSLGFAPALQACISGTDAALESNGIPNLAIECEPAAAEGGSAVINQQFDATSFIGQRVRWTGLISTQDVTGSADPGMFPSGANLSLRVDRGTARNSASMIIAAYSQDPGIMGDTDWTRVAIVVDVPPDAGTITTGFSMAGAGRAWLRDPAFEVVGPGVALTPVVPLESDQGPGPDLRLNQSR